MNVTSLTNWVPSLIFRGIEANVAGTQGFPWLTNIPRGISLCCLLKELTCQRGMCVVVSYDAVHIGWRKISKEKIANAIAQCESHWRILRCCWYLIIVSSNYKDRSLGGVAHYRTQPELQPCMFKTLTGCPQQQVHSSVRQEKLKGNNAGKKLLKYVELWTVHGMFLT